MQRAYASILHIASEVEGMSQITLPFIQPSSDENELFSLLKNEIDDVCLKIAEKYCLFDGKGRPKKSFVLDLLAKNFCPSCIIRELTQMRRDEGVDALYREGHSLAVGLLVEALRYWLGESGINARVEGEVSGEFGRPDIVVRVINQGILVELGDLTPIIELKTGLSVSLAQILKYAIERPRSIIVVWRIRMRQIITLDIRKHMRLLLAFMFSIISWGQAVLSCGESAKCSHNSSRETMGRSNSIENPQEYLDGLFTALEEALPQVVGVVADIIRGEIAYTNHSD